VLLCFFAKSAHARGASDNGKMICQRIACSN